MITKCGMKEGYCSYWADLIENETLPLSSTSTYRNNSNRSLHQLQSCHSFWVHLELPVLITIYKTNRPCWRTTNSCCTSIVRFTRRWSFVNNSNSWRFYLHIHLLFHLHFRRNWGPSVDHLHHEHFNRCSDRLLGDTLSIPIFRKWTMHWHCIMLSADTAKLRFLELEIETQGKD